MLVKMAPDNRLLVSVKASLSTRVFAGALDVDSLSAGLSSGSIGVKMIMVMWIIHIGDLKGLVISILQIRSLCNQGGTV